MKKRQLPAASLVLLLALAAGLLLLSACQAQEEEAVQICYQVYFPRAQSDFTEEALGSEDFYLAEGEDPVPALLRRLLRGPKSESLRAVIPPGTALRDWSLQEGVLRVDFSSRYGLLSGIELTLADYSVTMTLTQIATITALQSSVEGERITYRDRDILRAEDLFSFVEQPTAPQEEAAAP